MKRDRCGGCGSDQVATFLDLGSTPAANTLPTFPDTDEVWWPLQLGVCQVCWLVQQMEIVPDHILYGGDYDFYSGSSGPKVTYHQDLAARLLATYPKQARRLTVEVACNDGDLLRHFHDADCVTLGVDPATGPVRVARERGLQVEHTAFTATVADDLRGRYGPAGVIIANHVVAHVNDVHDFFTGVDTLLTADGVAVVEVQYLLDLVVGNQLDHVYHEHRYHFSIATLTNIAATHHLYVLDVCRTPAQSGSISVTLGRNIPTHRDRFDTMLAAEWWLSNMAAYQTMQGRAEHVRTQLRDLIDEQRHAGRRVAGYGAPAKAVTLLNWSGITADDVRYILDTTPAKQGKYLPGTRIPIVGRRTPGGVGGRGMDAADVYLMLVWNYAGDVLRREHEFTRAGGQWIIPIPVPVLI